MQEKAWNEVVGKLKVRIAELEAELERVNKVCDRQIEEERETHRKTLKRVQKQRRVFFGQVKRLRNALEEIKAQVAETPRPLVIKQICEQALNGAEGRVTRWTEQKQLMGIALYVERKG